ncbi:MAG: IS110 family transposase [Proteobacteria bacterium]|nr:IS110 family transposase [Pseudomonadota bacterium]
MNATSIGVDLSKSVFQVSLANAAGRVIEQKRLSRAQYQRFLAEQPAAEIVMEACATAHHWARTARALGHQPCLLHAQYVRPYVRRNKTDAADADALVRARRDPDLKPVPVKSVDQQALQGLHRIRQQWVATRRQRITLARGLLAEFGLSLPTGASGIVARLHAVIDRVPGVLVSGLTPIIDEIGSLEARIKQLDRQLTTIAKTNLDAQHLMSIPGVGVIIATALVGSVADIHSFKRARQFAAWLGLTPREYSSGQTRYLGRISKRGDGYLRMLLTHGARSALLLAHRQASKGDHTLTSVQRWVLDVEQRTHHNKATIALANKMARIIWAVWTSGEDYLAD